MANSQLHSRNNCVSPSRPAPPISFPSPNLSLSSSTGPQHPQTTQQQRSTALQLRSLNSPLLSLVLDGAHHYYFLSLSNLFRRSTDLSTHNNNGSFDSYLSLLLDRADHAPARPARAYDVLVRHGQEVALLNGELLRPHRHRLHVLDHLVEPVVGCECVCVCLYH